MIICIVGDPNDLTSVYMGWLARRRGFTVLELQEDSLGHEWNFEFNDTDIRKGVIYTNANEYPFDTVLGAYVRLNPHPRLPVALDLKPQEEAVLVLERRHSIQYFLNLAPFPVANRLCAGRSNGSKPYQMQLLAHSGFTVPKWIVTNEAFAFQEFVSTCLDKPIYKSCSGLRSHVRNTNDELLGKLQKGTSPVIIQEYIPGREVRVHIVGNCIFPTEVLTSTIDYRFDEGGGDFRLTNIPTSLGKQCCDFAKSEGLLVAGFDFRLTANEEWYCLEMNPAPTFLPYEIATKLPIGDSILDAFEQGVLT